MSANVKTRIAPAAARAVLGPKDRMDQGDPQISTARVVSAEFMYSAARVSQIKNHAIPEIALVGRSNVGKSTLINTICGRKGLAHVGKTPGSTATLNFFRITLRSKLGGQLGGTLGGSLVSAEDVPASLPSAPEPALAKLAQEEVDAAAFIVDLPGYGFAKVSQKQRGEWRHLIESYLLGRPELSAVLLLIDSRRESRAEEQWLAELGRRGTLLVIATKADKLPRRELRPTRERLARELGIEPERVLVIGAGMREELGALRRRLFEVASEQLDQRLLLSEPEG